MNARTCIVVPCYNEAERFKTTDFLDFVNGVPDIDLCFVDDGSQDETQKKILELQCQCPKRIEVIAYAKNRGKAEAVREGFLRMQELKKYRWIAFADADLATPLSEMLRLITIAQQNKEVLLVMGSRLEHMGGVIRRKFYRHFTGRIFAGIVSVMFDLDAYDTQCGAKVFHQDVVDCVFERSFISRWLFDIEMLLRIQKRYPNYKQVIQEVPLNIWLEQGNSKIRFVHLLRMPLQLCKIYTEYKIK